MFRRALHSVSNKSIYVALSSGVDSSTVAAILADKYPGHVTGFYMNNWSSEDKCTEVEWTQVQMICEQLKIPCFRHNLESEYWTEVFEPMLQQYKDGRTPNPDVACNRVIKFGHMFDYLKNKKSDGDFILATGHYAGLSTMSKGNKMRRLIRPKHLAKDQTYYLAQVDPTIWSRVIFPLHSFSKTQVRRLAMHYKLPVANKPDSQGLCFVDQQHTQFRNFLDAYLEPEPGMIRTESGQIVGSHNGLWHATVGQKCGVCLPQGDDRFRGTWYVSEKDYKNKDIIIVKGFDHPSLYSIGCTVKTDLVLFDSLHTACTGLYAQYRSLQTPIPLQSISLNNGILYVTFAHKCRAVTPGQYLVLYDGNTILGSGVIESVQRLGEAHTL